MNYHLLLSLVCCYNTLMSLFAFLIIFLLGTIIGSFLNVVIYRFNTGKPITRGRSICMNCNRNLRWYELIPLFSFFLQKGKCRRCASLISHQYPLVEFLTGIVFVLVSYTFLPVLYSSYPLYFVLLTIFVFVFSILIVISVYDLRHKIIPDKLVYIFIIVSFLTLFINSSPSGGISIFVFPTLINLIAGPALALPFALIWYFSNGHLMGLGDGKLILGIGWFLGLSAGFFAVILSFWIGTIISLLLLSLSNKKINMQTEIPFAPFLIISTFITFLFSFDFFSLMKLFSF